MKKFLKKIRSYGFWVALASAVVVLLNSIGKLCGFSIENKVVEDAILSVASFLAVLGIVNMNGKKVEEASKVENSDEESQEENEKDDGGENANDKTNK